jgi:VWFA-related protein
VVIRSTTELVQVHVVATDAHGSRVADLKRGDFEVLDNHKPQPLTLFTADRGSSVSAASGSHAGKSAGETETTPGYALLVIDWLNTKYADQIQSQEKVVKLLKSFQPRQRVALYLLGSKPRLLHDFTSDMDALVQAAESAVPEFDEMDNTPVGRFDARYGGATGSGPSPEEKFMHDYNRIRETLDTFEWLAERLATLPGRKTLLWLTNAFPVILPGPTMGRAPSPAIIYTQDFERLLAKLNSADVAVYPIDAQGLQVLPHSRRDTMMELASRTGGNGFYDRNDLDEGMRLALEDTAMSYTLGFHAPEGAAPGIHEITVRVNRPKVKLRYRESYQIIGPN